MGSIIANRLPRGVLGMAALALLIAVPIAAAAEEGPTRDEYVAAVEPICKQNARATSRILKGVKGQVRKNKLVPAGRKVIRASRSLRRAVRRIDAVPKPAADTARLERWVGLLTKQSTSLLKVGKALKAGKKFRAQKAALELNKANRRANNTVISFDFRHCRTDSSKYL